MADSDWKPKLRRARHHERALEAAVHHYSELDPFELVSRYEGNDLVVRVHIRHEIPEELSLIVGDLLHNARSALDLLITSAAWDFASESGTELTPVDERKLFFPVTRTESDFDNAAKKIEPYLSEETMTRIRIVQPWSLTAARLAQEDDDVTADEVQLFTWLDLVWRLQLLDNLDKHRQVVALDFRSGTITLGDQALDLLDEGNEPEGEPVNFDDLDPEIQANLLESFRKIQEEDERPDSYDFFFAGEELHDGAEIGRHMRHDGGPMPGGLTARGNLRFGAVGTGSDATIPRRPATDEDGARDDRRGGVDMRLCRDGHHWRLGREDRITGLARPRPVLRSIWFANRSASSLSEGLISSTVACTAAMTAGFSARSCSLPSSSGISF
jgi:hypothetical protein